MMETIAFSIIFWAGLVVVIPIVVGVGFILCEWAIERALKVFQISSVVSEWLWANRAELKNRWWFRLGKTN